MLGHLWCLFLIGLWLFIRICYDSNKHDDDRDDDVDYNDNDDNNINDNDDDKANDAIGIIIQI